MKKKGKARKPRSEIYAHGAVNPVKIKEMPPPDDFWTGVTFGATIGEADYPVSFYGVKNIRKLSAWLNKAADYLESREE